MPLKTYSINFVTYSYFNYKISFYSIYSESSNLFFFFFGTFSLASVDWLTDLQRYSSKLVACFLNNSTRLFVSTCDIRLSSLLVFILLLLLSAKVVTTTGSPIKLTLEPRFFPSVFKIL